MSTTTDEEPICTRCGHRRGMHSPFGNCLDRLDERPASASPCRCGGYTTGR